MVQDFFLDNSGKSVSGGAPPQLGLSVWKVLVHKDWENIPGQSYVRSLQTLWNWCVEMMDQVGFNLGKLNSDIWCRSCMTTGCIRSAVLSLINDILGESLGKASVQSVYPELEDVQRSVMRKADVWFFIQVQELDCGYYTGVCGSRTLTRLSSFLTAWQQTGMRTWG